MIRNVTAAFLTALVTAATGHAEGRVSFTASAGDMGQMKMTERWRGKALRTDIEGVDAYMLLRDDTVYSITTAGGQLMVMDLLQLKDMPGAAQGGKPSKNNAGVVFPERIEDIREIDETREIAGITGEVYDVEWTASDGNAQTDTAVLTDDPRLLEHQSLKIRLIRKISDDEPNPLLLELEARGLAALSFGDRFLVTKVGEDAGPAGDFELPAEPIDFGNMMNMGNQ